MLLQQQTRPTMKQIMQPGFLCNTREKLVDMLVYVHYWLYDRPAKSDRLPTAQLIEDRLLGERVIQ